MDKIMLYTLGILAVLAIVRVLLLYRAKRAEAGSANSPENQGAPEPPPEVDVPVSTSFLTSHGKTERRSSTDNSAEGPAKVPFQEPIPEPAPEPKAPPQEFPQGTRNFVRSRSAEGAVQAQDLTDQIDGLDPLETLLREINNFGASVQSRLGAIREAGRRQLKEAIPRLIEVLYDPDPVLSGAAAESLGEIGDVQAIEPLLEISRRVDEKLLEECRPQGAETAAETERGIQAPGNALMIPEVNPFKYKEMTLFRIDLLPAEYKQSDGTPIARKELVKRGLKDNDQQLRKMAAKAAIGLNDPELTASLVETLQNPYEVESVRYLAAEALGGIEDTRAVEPLLKALDDENVAVRYSAAAALSMFQDPLVTVRLVKALKDPNEFVRSSVAHALANAGAKPEALKALFDTLEDQSEVVRFSAAQALGTIGGKAVLDGVKQQLSGSGKTRRAALIETLGNMKGEEASGLLRHALNDADSDIRFKASMALMSQDSFEALDDLIEAAKRMDNELKEYMGGNSSMESGEVSGEPGRDSTQDAPSTDETEAFKNVGAVDGVSQEVAIQKLREALQHASPNVRGCAANALGDFTIPSARNLLIESLRDEHEYVRSKAVSSLARMATSEDVREFLAFVNDPSEEVRYAVANALGRFDDKQAKSALKQLSEKDKSRDVKRAARQALEGRPG